MGTEFQFYKVELWQQVVVRAAQHYECIEYH